jgi:plastocyanin
VVAATDIRFASPTEAIITVQNLNDVEHRAGPFLVGAGQAFVQRFPEPGRYPLVCTVDPLESVVVTVEV